MAAAAQGRGLASHTQRGGPCPAPDAPRFAPRRRPLRLRWSTPRNASPSPPHLPEVAHLPQGFPFPAPQGRQNETAMEAGSRRGTITPPPPSFSLAFLVSRCDMRVASRSVGGPSLLLTSAVLWGPGGAGKQCRLGCNGVTFIPPLPHPGLVKTQKRHYALTPTKCTVKYDLCGTVLSPSLLPSNNSPCLWDCFGVFFLL